MINDPIERFDLQPKGLFAESLPIFQQEYMKNYLDLSVENKSKLLNLEKSIQEQNKLLSKQLSRFFEQTKEIYSKSLDNIKHAKVPPNQLKTNYSYHYQPHDKLPQKNLSFRKIKKLSWSSKNINLAMERDSMKNLQKLPTTERKENKEKNQTNLFKSGTSNPKIYSRKNMKLVNESQERKRRQNMKKRKMDNLSESMKGITAIDFGTLGKEGNTIWVTDDSISEMKPKFHYLGKIQNNSQKTTVVKRKMSEKQNKFKVDIYSKRKNTTQADAKKTKVNKVIEQRSEKKNSNKPAFDLESMKSNQLVVSDATKDKDLKSMVSPVSKNVKHKRSNRAMSVYAKNKRASYMYENKYKIMRNLDKKIKQTRNQSVKSTNSNGEVVDPSLILKERQLKMREIRRNYMKKWKEKQFDKSPSESRFAKKNTKKSGKSKSRSVKTYSRKKVNQWGTSKTDRKFAKGLSTLSNDSSLGSLNRPPVSTKLKKKAKNSVSLYKKRKVSNTKSVKKKAKAVKKGGNRKKKIESNKQISNKAIIQKHKKMFTNKFDSTKKAFFIL